MQDDLIFLYQQLREQLDAAYAAPVWQRQRIALITSDMLRLERTLASQNSDSMLPSGYPGTLPLGSGHAALGLFYGHLREGPNAAMGGNGRAGAR